MSEISGRISFINSHDYISDVTGTEVVGCMASLRAGDGTEVIVFTQSLRLQHTLEMAYATQHTVTVDCDDASVALNDDQERFRRKAPDAEALAGFEEPLRLKAVWTLA